MNAAVTTRQEQLIRAASAALRSGCVLHLLYRGYPRELEVHAVGVSREGRAAMLCWQVGGMSHHGEITGWKFLYFDEASDMKVTERASRAPRSPYRSDDKRFRRILAQL